MSVKNEKYGEPRLRRSYSVIGHSPDVVEIRTGVWSHRSFTLTDERASGKLHALVRGLDGSLSHRELASQVGVPAPRSRRSSTTSPRSTPWSGARAAPWMPTWRRSARCVPRTPR